MPRYRIISENNTKDSIKDEIYLNSNEESEYRLSHGLYEFLQLEIMPTETNLLRGKIGVAFMKIWKLRKRRKDIYSLSLNDRI